MLREPGTLARCALIVCTAVALFQGLDAAAEEPGRDVGLRWALAAIEAGQAVPVAVTKDVKLPSGTQLKFLIEPLSDCSIYVLLLDSSDEIHRLHDGRSSGPGRTYVPPGDGWMWLDGTEGLETFFVLASAEPLPDLEALLERHAAAAPGARRAMTPEIVREIRRLQKDNRSLSVRAERPALIAGRTKGGLSAAAINDLAVDIHADRFYSKTITIEH